MQGGAILIGLQGTGMLHPAAHASTCSWIHGALRKQGRTDWPCEGRYPESDFREPGRCTLRPMQARGSWHVTARAGVAHVGPEGGPC